jgi:hypothetical protein
LRTLRFRRLSHVHGGVSFESGGGRLRPHNDDCLRLAIMDVRDLAALIHQGDGLGVGFVADERAGCVFFTAA